MGFAAFAVAEPRVAAAGGSPLIPGRVLRLPGVAMGIAAMFAVLAVFGGMLVIVRGALGRRGLGRGVP